MVFTRANERWTSVVRREGRRSQVSLSGVPRARSLLYFEWNFGVALRVVSPKPPRSRGHSPVVRTTWCQPESDGAQNHRADTVSSLIGAGRARVNLARLSEWSSNRAMATRDLQSGPTPPHTTRLTDHVTGCPVRSAFHIHLQRGTQLRRLGHLDRHPLHDRLPLIGRDLKNQLVMNLQ